MTSSITPEESYLVLIKFLIESKQRLFELGAKQGLSRMQVVILLLLDAPHPMGTFTKLLNCDPSNVTGIVDGLEQKGLAARYDVEGDRRIKMVKLSPKGRRVRAGLLRKLTASDDYLLAKLTPAETEIFIKLVRKITA
jgi:DNA-binding MarR family transcriptional regulator